MKDLYFISEETKLIFGLAELEGKKQLDFLGIDYEYFCDRELAKNWYKHIKQITENKRK